MADALGEDDLTRINENLDQLNIADDQIKQAKQAGIDVTDFEQQSREQRIQLNKLKSTYFPGQ